MKKKSNFSDILKETYSQQASAKLRNHRIEFLKRG